MILSHSKLKKGQPGPLSVPAGIKAMLVGCVLIYCVMFATGNYIYGNWTVGATLTALAILSALILIRLWKRIRTKVL